MSEPEGRIKQQEKPAGVGRTRERALQRAESASQLLHHLKTKKTKQLKNNNNTFLEIKMNFRN